MSQKVSCNDCTLSSICLPMAVNYSDLARLEEIMQRGRPLRRGEHLYRAGDRFEAVHAVRTGAIKTYALSEDGTEQVTGFYLPGEIMGMDGIHRAAHQSSARALDSTTVCQIPFERLEELSHSIQSLQHHLFTLMSNEICAEREMHMLLGKKSAEDRMAAFLLALSVRHSRRGLSADRFRLPMSRYDIANYLGLAVETVSRIFTRFQKAGTVRVEGRDVTILDHEALAGDNRIQVQQNA